MSLSSESRVKAGLEKIFWFLFGLVLAVIGIVAIFNGEISSPQPLGLGGLWNVSEEPFRFWSSVVFSITIGCWIMYVTITRK